jgi:cardiolipin-specific phospholipase
MDVQGGRDSLKLLKAAGNNKVSCHVVSGAGHHLYLDNPEESNKLLQEAIKAIPTYRG